VRHVVDCVRDARRQPLKPLDERPWVESTDVLLAIVRALLVFTGSAALWRAWQLAQ
jgi:hypothetical protein